MEKLQLKCSMTRLMKLHLHIAVCDFRGVCKSSRHEQGFWGNVNKQVKNKARAMRGPKGSKCFCCVGVRYPVMGRDSKECWGARY